MGSPLAAGSTAAALGGQPRRERAPKRAAAVAATASLAAGAAADWAQAAAIDGLDESPGAEEDGYAGAGIPPRRTSTLAPPRAPVYPDADDTEGSDTEVRHSVQHAAVPLYLC